jgi:hypothetical protein
MRTDAQRIAKYNARMLSSLVDPTLSAVNALQKANFAAYVSPFYIKQQALRVIINAQAIPPWAVFGVEAFNGEMYKYSKQYAGAMLDARALMLCNKWGDASHLGAALRPLLVDISLALYGAVVV